MKAIEISKSGPPEVLRLVDRPDPAWGPGEVLLRVRASGVNRPDVLQRKGLYPAPAGASDLPGLEVAGTIEAGDTQALAQAGLAFGDRVCALLAGGGSIKDAVADLERRSIEAALEAAEGNKSRAAASLGISRFALQRKLDKYGIGGHDESAGETA